MGQPRREPDRTGDFALYALESPGSRGLRTYKEHIKESIAKGYFLSDLSYRMSSLNYITAKPLYALQRRRERPLSPALAWKRGCSSIHNCQCLTRDWEAFSSEELKEVMELYREVTARVPGVNIVDVVFRQILAFDACRLPAPTKAGLRKLR